MRRGHKESEEVRRAKSIRAKAMGMVPPNHKGLHRDYQDRESSIDAYLDDKFKHVDWNRRRRAESSLVEWVDTYCIGLLLED